MPAFEEVHPWQAGHAPTIDNVYDLGTPQRRWRRLYVGVPGVEAAGSVTFAAGETSKAVTFATALSSAAYRLTLGVGRGTGTPPAVAAVWSAKTTAGFTLTLTSDPGTGNTIIVDWVASL